MRHALPLCLILIIATLSAPGCDESASSQNNDLAATHDRYQSVASQEAQSLASPAAASEPPPRETALPVNLHTTDSARRIIFNADLDLVVDDFTGVPARVAGLAKAHGGFVAESSIHGSVGEPRDGRWTLRIPSGSFDGLLADADTLGQIRSTRSSSEEVTAEYVDLQSRLRNKLAEERRLAQHLETSTGDLEDILRVERELSRVRGEAEVLQGRLNVLADLTAMSTVTVRVEEIKDYVPEPTQEPGFTAQAGRAWSGSVSALSDAGRSVALAGIALVPWLIVILPAAGVAIWGARRLRARAVGRTVPTAADAR